MTGELVDIFLSRREGVMQIAQFMADHLNGEVLFYSAKQGFVDSAEVSFYADSIASANWHASASLIAKSINQAVLVDIGSTTSDLILIKDGLIASHGFKDAERMRFDELIYAGVVRTPLMAVQVTTPLRAALTMTRYMAAMVMTALLVQRIAMFLMVALVMMSWLLWRAMTR
jgi:probable H4MPT-linked C1 transfer pathway protein